MRRRHPIARLRSTLRILVAALVVAGVGFGTLCQPTRSLTAATSPSRTPVTEEEEEREKVASAIEVEKAGHGTRRLSGPDAPRSATSIRFASLTSAAPARRRALPCPPRTSVRRQL